MNRSSNEFGYSAQGGPAAAYIIGSAEHGETLHGAERVPAFGHILGEMQKLGAAAAEIAARAERVADSLVGPEPASEGGQKGHAPRVPGFLSDHRAEAATVYHNLHRIHEALDRIERELP